MENRPRNTAPHWQHAAYRIIFESNTPAGRAYDIVLLVAIGLSVGAVMLESVKEIRAEYGPYLHAVEWFFTVLFIFEYLLRLVVVRRPLAYALSLLGIIDFMAAVPTLAALLLPGSRYLLVIRTLRLLRVFRIFKLGHFMGEGEFIVDALKASRFKITVFLTAVFSLVIVIGTLMYVIEGGQHGFSSIPESVYWAIGTVTTVGSSSNITPATVLGQTLTAVLMILGFGIIAVPTGIVSSEMTQRSAALPAFKQARCPRCQAEGHRPEATFCWHCGEKI
ncbi:ion transporter [Hymenobacter sp. BT770]|uniref:ion transporter n=1 Tax=Hymenobacter sp. BT770 TaxID=2886942 RepID=UPI001D121B3E|nr:ion transporter [Hymenobacter sp. BT770]MCC3155456.1 ion transporter [Hymenobacter sp. BT770]MDO3417463.1 ion transporter [Hymenobacter sp. BT770]